MIRVLKQLLRQQDGQDMIEYALLLAFVVLSSAALYIHNAKAVSTIWGVADNHLSEAQDKADTGW